MLLDQRAVRYVPHGEKVGIVPHLSLTTTSVADGGALSMSVSEVIYGTLPEVFEIGVEVWNGSAWVEGQDCRFLVTKSNVDRQSAAAVKQLSGISTVLWLLTKNALAGVVPKTVNGITVEPANTVTGITGSGIELHRTAHGLHSGRRVKVTKRGNAAQLSEGSMLWVREPWDANNFRLAASMETIHAKNVGPAASGIELTIYREQLLSSGHGFKLNEKIRFANVGASGLDEDTAYYVRQVQPNFFLVSKEIGGLPVTFESATGITAYRDLDGDRLFRDATVGEILLAVIAEAKARGWGASVATDFTATRDSLGNLWSTTVATEDGLPIGFRPGTNARQILNALADAGYIEYATQGRTLRVFNLGSGRQLGLGNQPVRVGDDALTSPTGTNLDNLLTHLTIRGDGPVLSEVASTAPMTALGRLEQYTEQANIATDGVATDIGRAMLKRAEDPEREFTITENATEAKFLPHLHYVRGDWVRVDVNGEVKQMRVAGISCTSGEDGTQVSVTLGIVMRDLLVKLAQGQGRISGGIGTGGAGQLRPVTNSRRPASPQGLLVQAQPMFNLDGTSSALLTVSFQPVLHDSNGYLLNVPAYQVWVRGDGDEGSSLLGSPTVGATTVGPVPAGRIYYVSVRGRSEAGVWGEYSPEFEVFATPPVDPPFVPTPPTVTSELGVLHIGWDGQQVDPAASAPVPVQPGFGYWFAEVSEAVDGTYVPIGQTLLAVGEVFAGGLTIGAEYWVRTYAVSRVGVASDPTTPVSVVLEGISLGDLDAEISDAINDAVNGAADAAAAATEAAAAANGKNRMFHAVIDPDQPGTADGDIWHRWTNLGTSGKLLATWRWDATAAAWTPTALDATYIPLLDIGQGTFGNLSGQRLDVNTVTANKLLIGGVFGDNMLEDPGLAILTGGPWQVHPDPVGGNTRINPGGTQIFERYLHFDPDPAGSVYVPCSTLIPCQPGEKFAVSFLWWNGSGPGFEVRANMRAWLANGSTVDTVIVAGGSSLAGVTDYEYTAPANAVRFNLTFESFKSTNAVGIALPSVRRMTKGSLVVDGTILARHLKADEIWANTAWVNHAKVNTLTAGSITGTMIQGTAIDGKTITGSVIRTAASGARVQIDSAGLRAFNSGGTAVTTISSSTGQIDAIGGIRTGTAGQRVEISGSTARFYNPGGFAASITGFANGASGSGLGFSAGGNDLVLGNTNLAWGGSAALYMNAIAYFGSLMTGNALDVPGSVSGSVTGKTVDATGNPTDTTITFRANSFNSAPNVQVTPKDAARDIWMAAMSVTASSFVLRMAHNGGVTTGTRTGQAAGWIASE